MFSAMTSLVGESPHHQGVAMALAVFGEGSDIHLFKNKEDSYVCFGCRLTELEEEMHQDFITPMGDFMRAHLRIHIKNGHRVPFSVFDHLT